MNANLEFLKGVPSKHLTEPPFTDTACLGVFIALAVIVRSEHFRTKVYDLAPRENGMAFTALEKKLDEMGATQGKSLFWLRNAAAHFDMTTTGSDGLLTGFTFRLDRDEVTIPVERLHDTVVELAAYIDGCNRRGATNRPR